MSFQAQALHDIGLRAQEIAISKGWRFDNFGTETALMHSELSEALEGHRLGDPRSEHIPAFTVIEEEWADCIIRILGSAEARNLNVAEAVFAKMDFNATRPHRHGGKKF